MFGCAQAASESANLTIFLKKKPFHGCAAARGRNRPRPMHHTLLPGRHGGLRRFFGSNEKPVSRPEARSPGAGRAADRPPPAIRPHSGNGARCPDSAIPRADPSGSTRVSSRLTFGPLPEGCKAPGPLPEGGTRATASTSAELLREAG